MANTIHFRPRSEATFVSTHEQLRGVNVTQPFAHWGDGEPWNRTRGWDQWMPDRRLAACAAAGFEFLRLCVNPAPLLDAGTGPDLDATLAPVLHAVDRIHVAGLKVILDVHVGGTDAIWNVNTLTDGPGGPKYTRLLALEVHLARLLAARYSPHMVAFELFNEPPYVKDFGNREPWPDQLRTLYGAVRAAAPEMTLLVAGADLASPDALMQLDGSQFDRNTVFVFHFYEPNVFCFQGLDLAHFRYIRRLGFPPREAHQFDVLNAARARIMARPELSAGEKFGAVKTVLGELVRYFHGPEDGAFIRRRFEQVAAWADRHRVGRNRLICGEFGSYGDIGPKVGAALPDRVRWTRAVRSAADATRFNWCVHDLYESFRITDDNGAFVPEILNALGLRTT